MNAYELANELEKAMDEDSWCQECGLEHTEQAGKNAATMLRQQADRIAELEDKLHWLVQHPVKQLNDEEIMEIVADKYAKGQGRYADCRLFYIEFARAIIKEITE